MERYRGEENNERRGARQESCRDPNPENSLRGQRVVVMMSVAMAVTVVMRVVMAVPRLVVRSRQPSSAPAKPLAQYRRTYSDDQEP